MVRRLNGHFVLTQLAAFFGDIEESKGSLFFYFYPVLTLVWDRHRFEEGIHIMLLTLATE